VYVRGSQWIQSRMCGDVRHDFLGKSRYIQADVNIRRTCGGLQQICKLGISRDFAELVLLRRLVFVLIFGEKGEEQAGGWKDSV
jgi:hypothetical protein